MTLQENASVNRIKLGSKPMPSDKLVTFFLFFVLVLALNACSPLRLINLTNDRDAYAVSKNIVYGSHDAQKLDVYQPVSQCKSCPVLIWVHGGAWQSGSKDLYSFIGSAFTAAGFVVVIPDYRKYPALFPSFVNDIAKAISWVRDNINHYRGDADKLNLIGHSSGAHISMLLAYDSRYLGQAGVSLNALQTVVGLAGPYDFLPLKSPVIKEIFSEADPLSLSQPINFVNRLAPPVLLVTGLKDKRVDPQNSVRMAAAVSAAGGKVVLLRYPELGHAGILLSLSSPLRSRSSVYDDVLEFLNQTGEHEGM